jgi:exonuclease SbcC
LANAEGQSEKANAAALQAAAILDKERARSNEITELGRKGDELVRHQQSFEQSIGFRNKATRATTSLSTAKTVLETAVAGNKRLGEEKARIETALSHARTAESERGKLQIQISSAETSHKAAVQFEQAFTAVTDAQTAVTSFDTVHKKAQAALSNAEQSFSAAEANLSEAQALHLSAKLADGQPCPVCGSSTHPAPAIGSIENAGFDHAFRIAKTSLSEARTLSQEAVKNFSSAEATLKERSQVLSAMEKPTQSAAERFNHLSQLSAALEVAELPSTSARLEAEIEGLDVKIQTSSAEIERLRTAREEAATAVAVTAQQLSQALDGIPETLRDPVALQQAIADNERLRTTQQDALTQAENSDRKLREAALAAQKDVEASRLAQSETQNRQQAAKKIFNARLNDSGLTIDAYEEAKARLETVDLDEITINKYVEELAIASNQLKVAKLAIEDQERPELQVFIDATTEAKDALNTAKTVLADAQAKLKTFQKLRSEVSEELSRLDKVEHDTAPLRELAAMFNAENPSRLDLETYAIGAMFDQVLTAANRRLEPMTSGRFMLEREVEEGKGRARRGLGIRVHDVHTGRARATATLSGGETFMAALSLALGLSDIVEASAGNIRLDTIFIDEGFGSLDTENDSGTLDQVLQTLTNLVSQNRAVGLISHVPLVQQTIPNGFYVRKTLAGSHIETRGVI